jgi:hypothetical protein
MVSVRAGIPNSGEEERGIRKGREGGMWNGGGRIVERHGMTNKIEGGEKQASDDQQVRKHDTSAISSSISSRSSLDPDPDPTATIGHSDHQTRQALPSPALPCLHPDPESDRHNVQSV